MFDLARWLLLTRHEMFRAWFGCEVEKLARFEVEKNTSKVRLKEWYDHFEATARTSKPCTIVLTLRMWYIALLLLVEPDIIGPETRWDQYLQYFEHLIILGEEVVSRLLRSENNAFSYDVGYVTPMFMVAHRCRDPSLRR